jgi:hypothetical protein
MKKKTIIIGYLKIKKITYLVIKMEKNKKFICIKESLDELLSTDFFKKIAKTNDDDFALRLAIWLIRYGLVVSSLHNLMDDELEEILQYLHGGKLKEILEFRELIYNIY